MSWKRKELEVQTDFIRNKYIQEKHGYVLSQTVVPGSISACGQGHCSRSLVERRLLNLWPLITETFSNESLS